VASPRQDEDGTVEVEVEGVVDVPGPAGEAVASGAVAPVDKEPPPRAAGRRGDAESDGLSYDASEVRARLLIASIERLGLPAGDEAVQERVAAIVGLVDDLRLPGDRALLLDRAEFALRQLALRPPNLVLCDRMIDQLRTRTLRGLIRGMMRVGTSANPHLIVASGVALAMVINMIVSYGFLPIFDRPDLLTLQLVTEAAFAGSLTSLMLRFNRWRGTISLTARDAFFEGLFRPFIGVFFAWMVYYLFKAGLVPFRVIGEGSEVHFHAGIAFVTGFSERLAVSFVDTLEKRAKE